MQKGNNNMKKWTLLVLLALTALVIAACGGEKKEETGGNNEGDKEKTEEVTIKHEHGETTVKKNPEKVVTFDLGVLDTLDELGIEVAGLPQHIVPNYLDKYKDEKYTNLGSLKEPDFEELNKMKPDVIFISGRQADMYEDFEEIAPTVFISTDYSKYMDSFKGNMETIGKVFGKEDEVQAKLDDINKQIDEVKSVTEKEDEKALITLANEGQVSAYGPNSRYGFIHDVFGVKPVDENIEVSQHGQEISYEYILEQNPDILFVIDRSATIDPEAEPAKAAVENDLVKKTNAYKNDKIVYLNGELWYLSGGGLQSMKEMINEVEAAIK